MNRVQPDNVHSTIFTPQEYQVELIDSCLQENTVAVLASRSTRTFLVTMVTRELSFQTRSIEQGGRNKCTLITGQSGPKLVKAGEAIQQNTNLAVATYTSLEQVKGWTEKWAKVLLESQVVVMSFDVLELGFDEGSLQFDRLNLFVVTDAHQLISSVILKNILSQLSPTCRILAMTSPVLNRSLSPAILDSLLSYLKQTTTCNIDTSSEIVTILRYVNKPLEKVIMCASPFSVPRPNPEEEIRRLTADALTFLEDHRYDLVEVYGPEYAEFCVGVPDPIKEPKQILKDFVTVLDELGLWCADRAALYSLVEIEKMKKKTAYDRHYLLLCLIFSVMARVRAVIESAFENHSELNQILIFSTPKVLRLIDILRQIRPLNFVDPRKRRDRTEASDGPTSGKVDEGKIRVEEEKPVDVKNNLKDLCSHCNCNLDPVQNELKDLLTQETPFHVEKSSCPFLTINEPEEVNPLGCENDFKFSNLSQISEKVDEIQSANILSDNIIVKKEHLRGIASNTLELSNDLTSSVKEDLLGDDINNANCDAIISNFNGSLSRSSSKDSFYESKLHFPFDPSLTPSHSASHSPVAQLVDKPKHLGSSTDVSSTSSSCEMISCSSSISPAKNELVFEKEEVCSCSCHSSIKKELNVHGNLVNGYTPSENEEEMTDVETDLVQNCRNQTLLSESIRLTSGEEMEEKLPSSSSLSDCMEENKEKELEQKNHLRSVTHEVQIDQEKMESVTEENKVVVGRGEGIMEKEITGIGIRIGKEETASATNVMEDHAEVLGVGTGEKVLGTGVEMIGEKVSEEEVSITGVGVLMEGEITHTGVGIMGEEKITEQSVEGIGITIMKEEKDQVKDGIKISVEVTDEEKGKSKPIDELKKHEDQIDNRDESDCRPINEEFSEQPEKKQSTKQDEKGEGDIDRGMDKTRLPEGKVDKLKEATNPEEAGKSDAPNGKEVPVAVTSEAVAMADTLAQLLPTNPKARRKRDEVKEKVKVHNPEDPDSVCGLVFVRNRTTAKIIYRLLKELSDIGGEFSWIFPQYTVELCKNAVEDPRAAEAEHKKQEEVFRRFRHHECNLLVSTSVLEEGIDIPNCNMVLRFDPASSYSSYVYSRGRAKGLESFYFHLVVKEEEEKFFNEMASYAAYEQVLLNKCGRLDRGTDSEVTQEEANELTPVYSTPAGASVSMATSISLLNKYCAKLPSDTFTRLTAMWEIDSRPSEEGNEEEYQCTIMLPINSPLKGYTKGSWMSKKSLAKMSTALECCRRLHEIGELNDNLLPVGKESMQLDAHLCAPLPDDQVSEGMPRPGSTKRRQYYYKKVSECLVGDEPNSTHDLWVYKLDMVLSCPIPDEQNTRGRKIYRPESSSRSLAVVTTKPIPQVSGFPVFTRSGEVMVRMKETHRRIRISETNLEGLKWFHMFTFTHVLRLEKYPIKFNPSNASSTFYIAPLLSEPEGDLIDWDFVKLIQSKGDHKPSPPTEDARKKFRFNQALYQDAVVMPWYRNQDQPQYFYVAEICSHLHPQSDFPDAGFESFEKYYLTKYGLQICNLGQPLLDVDHTSGRLNLLTPRHVNRKGVALPTTSEETKRAKRENLQQKQILVPELCTIHPFPASLWRKAVCLPTILYRINGLLLANELRVHVAREIGLGMTQIRSDFVWPNLDFGWTLADVLAKSVESSKDTKDDAPKTGQTPEEEHCSKSPKGPPSKDSERNNESSFSSSKSGSELEIGTWSNDMALSSPLDAFRDNEDDFEIENFDPNIELPDNLTLLDGSCGIGDDIEGELGADWGTGLTERKARPANRPRDRGDGVVRVGSPSNFESDGWDVFNGGTPMFGPYGTPNYDDYYDYGDDFDGYESEPEEYEDEAKEQEEREWEEMQGKRRTKNEKDSLSDEEDENFDWPEESCVCSTEREDEFARMIEENKEKLIKSKTYLGEREPIVIEKACRKNQMVATSATTDGSAQTDWKAFDLVHVKPILGEEVSVSEEDVHPQRNPTGKVDKGTQTDVVSVTADPVPEVSYEVMREETLLEVKAASEALSPVLLEEVENPFSFDYQPDLESHPGPPPSIILQALTMSNANDGVNLERLETIGDSYLKYAITNYLYCTFTQKHEGKLSYLRSKQVSNLNLYRLGKRKGLGECMVATKFEPHDNWLPPGYFVPRELEEALIDSGVPAGHWNMADFPGLHDLGSEEIRRLVHERSEQIKQNKAEQLANELISVTNPQDLPIFIPYNLLTQHSIPDKSISDCVEALIGAYLTTCGPRGALLFMSWLGIKVLPSSLEEVLGVTKITYHQLQPPRSPLDSCPLPNSREQLELLLSGYNEFEKKVGYTFRDRSYLLQAFTHASYYRNRLTDCYQRLEFLGDAVLDYLITRHLFEDKRQHSPGSLTDLRSALVNNTIFACLAVKFEFHKYFRHFSPGLDRVVRDFVRMQEENGHKINEEYYFMEEEECEAAEDIEVPKALGDVFESVAGAIFLDSGGSLDAVWKVYFSMMKNEIEQFSGVVPKSPIRELLETEPETAKFGKPERLVDGKVRVSVEIFGKGSFSGVGRNYRIAKSTAAKRALRHLKRLQVLATIDNQPFQ